MGVAVDTRWWSMGGPSGVCNTCVGIKDLGHIWLLFVDELPQLGNLANLLERKDFILLVSIYRKTGRVISSVFESREAIDKSVNDVFAVLLNQVIDAASVSQRLPGERERGNLLAKDSAHLDSLFVVLL